MSLNKTPENVLDNAKMTKPLEIGQEFVCNVFGNLLLI